MIGQKSARWILPVACIALIAFARDAAAAPEAHILRIDPRAGVQNGAPELTTIVEVVQFNPMSDVLAPCASSTGDAHLDCISAQMEKPGQLYSPFPFPQDSARLFVKINGEDSPAKFASKAQWGASGKDPNVGTAWLVAVDASSGMGARYHEAQEVAHEFIAAMGPNDLMDLMIFDDRPLDRVADSKWKTYKDRNDLVKVLQEHPTSQPSHGQNRPLFDQIKRMTKDAFGSLGNNLGPQQIPLHQAMVVLSNGAGRNDAASAAPSAEIFHQYLNKGRFPEDNTSLPKTPLPVISILFPSGGGFVNDTLRGNDFLFMESLANTEIGGFFDIVRTGQGAAKSKAIISIVKRRFNEMWIVKWRLSCLNASVEQTFRLEFLPTTPQIMPDATFKEVPIGVDPTQWPLDVNMARTKAEADLNPLYPGGQFRVYGDFCWSGDKQRAEAYFVPAGTKPNPAANNNDPELAKKAMQQLIAQNMRGSAVEAAETFVMLQVPDDEKILEGSGDNAVARVVVYDNKAHRASGHDEKSVLTLKAMKKPFPLLPVLGGVGGLVVVGLLVLVLMRGGGGGGGGGGGKRRAGPSAPVVAGGSPQQYSAPYQAPGPQGPAPYGAAVGPPPGPTPGAGPPIGYGGAPPPAMDAAGSPAVVQVKCPACGMLTMATPGQASVCFSCGQPLPASITGAGGAAEAPTFPLTGQNPSHAHLQPPANPYGGFSGATISGAPGQFAIRPGAEIRVGRDPAQCPVTLTEPRVSGVHATLKFEASQLWARDETSNNGTFISNSRIAAGVWIPVPQGAQLRFGPIEFSVRLEA